MRTWIILDELSLFESKTWMPFLKDKDQYLHIILATHLISRVLVI